MAKKISAKTIQALMKQAPATQSEVKYEVDGAEVIVTIKHRLTIEEEYDYVHKIVDTCFTADGEYRPVYKKYIEAAMFLMYFTNIPVPTLVDEGEKVMDIVGAYEMVEALNLYTTVCSRVSECYNNKIMLSDMIDQMIEYRKQTSIQAAKSIIDEKIETLQQMMDNMTNVLNSIDPEMVANSIKALNDIGTVNPQMIADAYKLISKEEQESTL